MRILLFGEYSGIHTNLKSGLQKLGHEVSIVSGGDGFKKIPADINVGSYKNNIIGKLERILKPFFNINKYKNYDIIQFVNSNPFTVFQLNKYLYKTILGFSDKTFLSACGDDPVFFSSLSKFKYHPYLDIYSNNSTPPKMSKSFERTHEVVLENITGIIPATYEYALGYRNYNKIRKTIPLPFDSDKTVFEENRVSNKVHFFHGINREFYKGSDVIIKAMKRLKDNYPNDVQITISDRLPLHQYLDILKSCNVVLDQCKSYSYAMNALYCMSLGKVVMSGSEEIGLSELGLNKTNCPVINIKPDPEQIYEELLNQLENRKDIPLKGDQSREFVKDFHCDLKIAQKYIDTWKI